MKKFLICFLCNLIAFANVVFAYPVSGEEFVVLNENPCEIEIDQEETLDIYSKLNRFGFRNVKIREKCIVYNGKTIKCETFVHAGMLYVPARQLLEFLNKELSYNKAENVVIITDSSKTDECESDVLMNYDLKTIETRTAKLSNLIVIYDGERLENSGIDIGVGKIGAILSCDDRLFIPLKTITNFEKLNRVYEEAKIHLIDDQYFVEEEWDSRGIEILSEESDITEEMLNRAMLKAANDFSEPSMLREISATQILFYDKPAIWVKIKGNLAYQTSLYPGQKVSKSIIYIIEDTN